MNITYQAVYGFLSGITEILPVSARAHGILLLKLIGQNGKTGVTDLLIHLAVLIAMYYSVQGQILKMTRARRLSRIPKYKRRNPLDVKSLMDSSFVLTMLIPMVPALLLFPQAARLEGRLVWVAGLLAVNGVILYIPQFYPTSNKDSRSLTRLEGILMGLGGAAGVLPGVSGLGAAASIGSICGVDQKYALNMVILLNMVLVAGRMALDLLAILAGTAALSGSVLMMGLLSAAAAFAGAFLGIRILRLLAEKAGFSVFAYYCWGLALFAFILNLMA